MVQGALVNNIFEVKLNLNANIIYIFIQLFKVENKTKYKDAVVHSELLQEVSKESYQDEANSTLNIMCSMFNLHSTSKPHLIPKIIDRELSNFEINFLNIDPRFDSLSVKMSHRLYINNITYHSIDFKTNLKRCNYIIKFKGNCYGEIKYFLEYNCMLLF